MLPAGSRQLQASSLCSPESSGHAFVIPSSFDIPASSLSFMIYA